MPYLTSRGGLISGLESLGLQGLPTYRLNLTRESQKELQDLAGNAMSSTVIAGAIASALIVSPEIMDSEEDTAQTSSGSNANVEPAPRTTIEVSRMDGRYVLIARSMTATVNTIRHIARSVRAWANLTARLCRCEGQAEVRVNRVYQCLDCRHTVCAACFGNPEHNYKTIPDQLLSTRKNPSSFRAMLAWILPVSVRMSGSPLDKYKDLEKDSNKAITSPEVWSTIFEAIRAAFNDILRFKSIKRAQIWTVMYDGEHSFLRLTIGRGGIQWFLYVKPPRSVPSVSEVREILAQPVARLKVADDALSLLEGDWEISTLLPSSRMLTFTGMGRSLPAFEARCGLSAPEVSQRTVWSHIRVDANDEAVKDLDIDIRGVYELLPNCEASHDSLHRRIGKPDVYFFLDPRKVGPPTLDCWVFTDDPGRVTGNVPRQVIARVKGSWKQHTQTSSPTSVNCFARRWVPCTNISIKNNDEASPVVCRALTPSTTAMVDREGDCYTSNMPLVAVTANSPLNESNLPDHQSWTEIDWGTRSFERLAWMWSRLVGMTLFSAWRQVEGAQFERCESCAPRKPRMTWEIVKRQERPIEDPYDAARFERDYKARPAAFKVFSKLDNQGAHNLGFTLNIKTLVHRVCAKYVGNVNESEKVEFFWRLATSEDQSHNRLRSFRVTNNILDPEVTQPPNFRVELRPDQLRSLAWMLSREADDVTPFMEEEIDEAFMEPLDWRAEIKMIVHRRIKGGILADHVGFGKTAVVLGLIDSQHAQDAQESEHDCKGAIPLKATLIVVPEILCGQWRAEIEKFLGQRYNVLALFSPRDLRNTAVQSLEQADIVLVAWPIFTGEPYFAQLRKIAGGPRVPQKRVGRFFEEWYADTMESIGRHVEILRHEGLDAFVAAIEERKNITAREDGYSQFQRSKRLRGAQLARATAAANNSASQSNERTSTATRTPQPEDDYTLEGIPESGQVKDLTCTPLHLYRFQRMVVDEFTYLDHDRHTLLASIKARSKWLLSGTPPITEFTEIRNIALVLGVHLSSKDDDRLDSRSEAEVFQSYRRVESEDWHMWRYGLAQRFLDTFMRQNIPEIPAIPWSAHFCGVELSAVERAVYLECKMLAESRSEHVKQTAHAKFNTDQSGRLNEVLDKNDTFEAALVKRCSYFDVQPKWSTAKHPLDTLENVVRHRQQQLNELVDSIKRDLRCATWLFKVDGASNSFFHSLEESVRTHDFGDGEVTTAAEALIDDALGNWGDDDWKEFWAHPDDKTSTLPPVPAKDDRPKVLREIVKRLRTNIFHWVDQARALRFMATAQQFQQPNHVTLCDACGHKSQETSTHCMLGKCGHIVCQPCSQKGLLSEYCPVVSCRSPVAAKNIIEEAHFGTYAEDRPVRMGGSKVEELITLLTDPRRIDPGEKVLVFVQYREMVKVVATALRGASLPFLELNDEEGKGVEEKIKRFTTVGTGRPEARILLLRLGTKNAAGL